MFEIDDVTAFIASLDITGKLPSGQSVAVTVYDYDGVKNSAEARACPIFQPDVTRKATMQSLERNSQGGGAVALQTAIYTLPYILLYQPAGAERGLNVIVPGLVLTLKAILTAIVQNDFITGTMLVSIRPIAWEFGNMVNDPIGGVDGKANYHGATIDLMIKELIN